MNKNPFLQDKEENNFWKYDNEEAVPTPCPECREIIGHTLPCPKAEKELLQSWLKGFRL